MAHQAILPFAYPNQENPCDHNMPTPCPPSTPITYQYTNSGRYSFQEFVDITTNSPDSNLMDSINATHYEQGAVLLLNSLNKFPVIESISQLHGSKIDHAYYICRLCTPMQCGIFRWKGEQQICPTLRTTPHIRNIGAMIEHLADSHKPDQSSHRGKLSIAAFAHVSEIRRVLHQFIDQQAFMMIRSSSDSCTIAMWKTNQESSHTVNRIDQHCLNCGLCLSHSRVDTTSGVTSALDLADHTYCICMPEIDTSIARPVTFIKEARRVFLALTPTMLRLPPIHRDGPISTIPPMEQSSIHSKSTGLSLGPDITDIHTIGTSPRMEYALKIAGAALPDHHQTESTDPGITAFNNREPVNVTVPTPLPSEIRQRPTTRRNGVRDGNWNGSHTFRRNRP